MAVGDVLMCGGEGVVRSIPDPNVGAMLYNNLPFEKSRHHPAEPKRSRPAPSGRAYVSCCTASVRVSVSERMPVSACLCVGSRTRELLPVYVHGCACICVCLCVHVSVCKCVCECSCVWSYGLTFLLQSFSRYQTSYELFT